MRFEAPPSISHLASRAAVLSGESYESAMRVLKAAFIIMAQMHKKDVQTMLGRYKKFMGLVPYSIDKVHE